MPVVGCDNPTFSDADFESKSEMFVTYINESYQNRARHCQDQTLWAQCGIIHCLSQLRQDAQTLTHLQWTTLQQHDFYLTIFSLQRIPCLAHTTYCIYAALRWCPLVIDAASYHYSWLILAAAQQLIKEGYLNPNLRSLTNISYLLLASAWYSAVFDTCSQWRNSSHSSVILTAQILSMSSWWYENVCMLRFLWVVPCGLVRIMSICKPGLHTAVPRK